MEKGRIYEEYVKRLENGEKVILPDGTNANEFALFLKEMPWYEQVVPLRIGNMISFIKEAEKIVPELDQLQLPGGGVTISNVAHQLAAFYQKPDNIKIYYSVSRRQLVTIDFVAVNFTNNQDVQKVLGLVKLDAENFVSFIEKDFNVGTYMKVEKNAYWSPRSMSLQAAKLIMAADVFYNEIPIIDRIYPVQMPFIQNGELLLMENGYDERFLSWVPQDAPVVRKDMPLDEAKRLLEEEFEEFCFASKQDKVNAIALQLTLYCRGLYPSNTTRTPMGFYTANTPRAGKDCAAGCSSVLYYGVAIEDKPINGEHGVNDEDISKTIHTAIFNGRSRIHFSNCKGYINSTALEAAITQEWIVARLLGGNKEMRAPNWIEYSLSANTGTSYTADLALRSVFVNLFYELEDPNERKFKKNLHVWIAANRDRILSAQYAFIRNWFEKGMTSGSTTFASFPDWARIVGGIMEAAGYDPVVQNDTLNATSGDRETADMKKLFEIAHEKWGQQWVKKGVLFHELGDEEGSMNELFGWINRDKSGWKNMMGSLFSKYNNRVLSSIKMEIAEQVNASRNEYRFFKPESSLSQDVRDVIDVRVISLVPHLPPEIDKAEKSYNYDNSYKNNQNSNNILENHASPPTTESKWSPGNPVGGEDHSTSSPAAAGAEGQSPSVALSGGAAKPLNTLGICPVCGKEELLWGKNGKWAGLDCLDKLERDTHE